MPPQAPHRFTVLDSWRGICACMVALFHFHAYNHIYNIPLFLNAGLYVDFFFVLSGFVIFINYYDRLKEGYSLTTFMRLRFGRLYPLHLFTLAAFVGIELIQIFIPPLANLSENPPLTGPGATPDYILNNLLMLHSLGIGERLSFNSPSWSISAEFWTYLVFALTVILLKTRAVWGILGLVALSLGFLLVYGEFMTTLNFGVVRCIYGFGAGALCCLVWKRTEKLLSEKLKTVETWSILEGFTVTLVLVFVSLAKETMLLYAAPLVFFATVYVFAFERGVISRLLLNRFFVILGTLSYSIYMTHAFIAGKIFTLGGKAFAKMTHMDVFTTINGRERLATDPWLGDAITLFYLAVVIACSILTYKFIEQPGRNYFRRTSNVPKPVLASA